MPDPNSEAVELSEAEFEARVSARVQARQRSRQEELRSQEVSARVRFWAAAPLRWTVGLAEAVEFPHQDPATVFKTLARNRIGTFTPETDSLRTDPKKGIVRERVPATFGVASAEAHGLLADYARELGTGKLGVELATIGDQVRRAFPRPPVDLAAWAELAAVAADPDEVSRELENRIRSVLDARKFNEVAVWVRAAERVRVVYEHGEPKDEAQLKAAIGSAGERPNWLSGRSRTTRGWRSTSTA